MQSGSTIINPEWGTDWSMTLMSFSGSCIKDSSRGCWVNVSNLCRNVTCINQRFVTTKFCVIELNCSQSASFPCITEDIDITQLQSWGEIVCFHAVSMQCVLVVNRHKYGFRKRVPLQPPHAEVLLVGGPHPPESPKQDLKRAQMLYFASAYYLQM